MSKIVNFDLVAEKAHELLSDLERTQHPKFGAGYIPTHDALVEALEALYLASLTTEESRPCRPKLVLDLPQYKDRYPALAPGGAGNDDEFAGFRITAQKIRQLAFAAPEGLVWSRKGRRDGRHGSIVGIGVEGMNEVELSAPAAGALDLSFQGKIVLSVRNGEVIEQLTNGLPTLSDVAADLCAVFHLDDETERKAVGRLCASFLKLKHGGSLWFSDNTDTPPARSEMIADRPRIKVPLERREMSTMSESYYDAIANMAAIDGAVLLDARLGPLGAGVFVNVDDRSERCHLTKGDGTHEEVPRDSIGGARHQSAISFCFNYPPAYALVLSSDGQLTSIVARDVDDVPLVTKFAPL